MSKMAAEIERGIALAFSNVFAFCFLQWFVCILVSNMDQEHILSNQTKMEVRFKMADQNQFF
jgi:hypothetical protein